MAVELLIVPDDHLIHKITPLGLEDVEVFNKAIVSSPSLPIASAKLDELIKRYIQSYLRDPLLFALIPHGTNWLRPNYSNPMAGARSIPVWTIAGWRRMEGCAVIALIPRVGLLNGVPDDFLPERVQNLLRRATDIPTLEAHPCVPLLDDSDAPRALRIDNIKQGAETFLRLKGAFFTEAGSVLIHPIAPAGAIFLCSMRFRRTASPQALRLHIMETWREEKVGKVFKDLVELDIILREHLIRTHIKCFIRTVYVTPTDLFCDDAKESAIFNIYHCPIRAHPRYWREFANTLKALDYWSPIFGDGEVLPSVTCRVCYGQDHPTYRCTYPCI